MQSSANLYDDLDGLLGINYTRSENIADQTEGESLSSHLQLIARLSPKLSLNLNSDYSQNLQEDTNDYGASGDLSWRPSDFLFVSVTAVTRLGATDTMGYSMRADMSISPRMRAGLRYGYVDSDRSDGAIQTVNGNMDVTISKLLTFFANGFYIMDDNDRWGANCSLRFRYNSF